MRVVHDDGIHGERQGHREPEERADAFLRQNAEDEYRGNGEGDRQELQHHEVPPEDREEGGHQHGVAGRVLRVSYRSAGSHEICVAVARPQYALGETHVVRAVATGVQLRIEEEEAEDEVEQHEQADQQPRTVGPGCRAIGFVGVGSSLPSAPPRLPPALVLLRHVRLQLDSADFPGVHDHLGPGVEMEPRLYT